MPTDNSKPPELISEVLRPGFYLVEPAFTRGFRLGFNFRGGKQKIGVLARCVARFCRNPAEKCFVRFIGGWGSAEIFGRTGRGLIEAADLKRGNLFTEVPPKISVNNYVATRLSLQSIAENPEFFLPSAGNFLVEKKVRGRRLTKFRPEVQKQVLDQIAEKVARRPLLDEVYRHAKLVKSLYSRMQEIFGPVKLVDFSSEDAELWYCTPSHGDLWADNVIVRGPPRREDADITLIDWEPGQTGLLPWWFDLVSIVAIPAFWPPGRECGKYLRKLLSSDHPTDSFNLTFLQGKSRKQRISFVTLFLLTQLVHKSEGGRPDCDFDGELAGEAQIIVKRFLEQFDIS